MSRINNSDFVNVMFERGFIHQITDKENLEKELRYNAGKVKIEIVPNIINITYGRDVGYKIEQEHFDKSIEDISATKIRAEQN